MLLSSCRCPRDTATWKCKKKKKKWRIYVASNNKTYLGLHEKFHIFLSDSNQISTLPNIKFRGNLSSSLRAIHADGQTGERTDRRTDRHDEANWRFSRLSHLKTRATQQLHLKCSSEFLQNKPKPTPNYKRDEELVSNVIQVVTQKGFTVHN
jgi:hypothetical protein